MGCTDAEKESQLNHYYNRKASYIEVLGGKCVECSSAENLEFDHVDPDSKSFTIASMLRCDSEKVLRELGKCQLLCEGCHLQKTLAEGSLGRGWSNKPRLVHGSVWTYKHHGCRCNVCVKSYRERYPSKRKYRDTGLLRHGQRRSYLKGCRCSLCKRANADYTRELKARRAPG